MSSTPPPTPPPSGYPPQQRNAKAEAKAAKAYAKAERPWYKKKRFIIPLVLAVIIIIAVATSGGSADDSGPSKVDNGSESNESTGQTSGSKDAPINVGETVELEGTRYTVTGVTTAPTVGNEFFSETANGIYVIVNLTIENTKDETKVFSDSAAKFIAGNDKSYSTDTDGTIASTGDGQEPLIFTEMQPDLPTAGTLVYDVPPGVVAGGLLEVSDLFGKGEAYINLGLA